MAHMRARRNPQSGFGGRGLGQYGDAQTSTAKELTGDPVPHLEQRALYQADGGEHISTDGQGRLLYEQPVYGNGGAKVGGNPAGPAGGRLTPPYPYEDPAMPPENMHHNA